MSIREGFKIEVERETANTKKMIERLSDEHLDFRPHPKSMSVKELANHIVEMHAWLHKAIDKNKFDFQTDYHPNDKETVAEMLAQLDADLEANLVQLDTISDEDWMTEWALTAGEHEIMKMPKIGAMRFIIQNHLIHHRGQLSVYLRLLDIPVPGIYGPSADEK